MKFRLSTWMLGAVVLMVPLAWESLLERHLHAGFGGWFGFYAGFGFAACVLLVFAALLLGRMLKRGEDYYDGDGDKSGGGDD